MKILLETDKDLKLPLPGIYEGIVHSAMTENFMANENLHEIIKAKLTKDLSPAGFNLNHVLPVGSIEFYQKVTGIKLKNPILTEDFPLLNSVFEPGSFEIKRKFRRELFEKDRELPSGERYFVKRADVFKSNFYNGELLPDIMTKEEILGNYNNEKLYISDVLDFSREFRVFLVGEDIIDVRQYIGDFDKISKLKDIRRMRDEILSYMGESEELFKKGWSFDYGETSDNKLVFIEYHPMIALGLYGSTSRHLLKGAVSAHQFEINRP